MPNPVSVLIFATQPGQPAVPLLSAWDLNSFSWIQRGTVQDMMAFMAKVRAAPRRSPTNPQTVAERTSPTQRQSVSENQFTAHVHARPAVDGVSGVLISDSEYPVRVAFSLLNKLLEEFMIKVSKTSWQTQANNLALSGNIPSKGEGIVKSSEFPQAQEYLARYQDPRQADTILRVQQELDDTKIVLVSARRSRSTTRSTRSCSAARTSTSSWKRVARSASRARCFTSRRASKVRAHAP